MYVKSSLQAPPPQLPPLYIPPHHPKATTPSDRKQAAGYSGENLSLTLSLCVEVDMWKSQEDLLWCRGAAELPQVVTAWLRGKSLVKPPYWAKRVEVELLDRTEVLWAAGLLERGNGQLSLSWKSK